VTHYTCDRCGVDGIDHGYKRTREVCIEWPNTKDGARVELVFDVLWPPRGMEGSVSRPDLCDDCYAHILHEVASMLDTDREPRPIGIPDVVAVTTGTT
jgi:hypothetical protein